ncbi:hypothetical protein E2C01_001057 [Portunus trituberculatus]|uniref:Uncharacterized protein n=1 Tax=Portunus trituberculatus TaxID=210409 RepID=A0A5B7CGN5_PORTR|nr:hypothetical protein [Portunus trituberculatus]
MDVPREPTTSWFFIDCRRWTPRVLVLSVRLCVLLKWASPRAKPDGPPVNGPRPAPSLRLSLRATWI